MSKKSFKKLDNDALKVDQIAQFKKVILIRYIIVDNIMFFIGYVCLGLQDILPMVTIIFIPSYFGTFVSACTIFTNIIMVGWFKVNFSHVLIMLPIVYVMNLIRVSITFNSTLYILDALLILVLLVPMSVLYFTGYVIGNAVGSKIKSPSEKKELRQKYRIEISKLEKRKEYLIIAMENASEEKKDIIVQKNQVTIDCINEELKEYFKLFAKIGGKYIVEVPDEDKIHINPLKSRAITSTEELERYLKSVDDMKDMNYKNSGIIIHEEEVERYLNSLEETPIDKEEDPK